MRKTKTTIVIDQQSDLGTRRESSESSFRIGRIAQKSQCPSDQIPDRGEWRDALPTSMVVNASAKDANIIQYSLIPSSRNVAVIKARADCDSLIIDRAS
jgi:hypothetical protein